MTCEVDMLWGPCGRPTKHHLKCPPHPPFPMCADHYRQATDLEEQLAEDPELMEKFTAAVESAVERLAEATKPRTCWERITEDDN